ncbi:MAG: FMN-binding protein [Ignavibacteriota bacterium]
MPHTLFLQRHLAVAPEVHERQSAEVDYVSGATQSANAFYYAVVEALSKAK